MKAAAEAGIPVVFFPEGTTSNGDAVLKFHSGLLLQALEADQPVTAAHLCYRLNQENGPSVTVANDVSYWGETSFLAHVFRFLGLRGVEADVRFAESPIAFSSDPAQRKLLAAEARAAVLELANLPTEVTVG
jgi:1-acyl-sn-glycerol-3-phosphate acyltransferase